MTGTDWAAFETRLRTYVRRRVDPLWVDDIVGNILLNLVQHRDTLQAAGNPLAFVQRVATNAVTDHYRRRSVETRALTQFQREQTDRADADDPDPGRTTGEVARCVLPFIEAMPEAYRDALMMTEIEGLTQAAAARRLGLSHSGMKSRVQRGRARLKHALMRCCEFELDRRGGVVNYARKSNECGQDC